MNPDDLLKCAREWYEDCARGWSQFGFVRPRGFKILHQQGGKSLPFDLELLSNAETTAGEFRKPPYKHPRKEFDVCVGLRHKLVPSLAILSGWVESDIEMVNDMSLSVGRQSDFSLSGNSHSMEDGRRKQGGRNH